jgi:hypothetical protein
MYRILLWTWEKYLYLFLNNTAKGNFQKLKIMINICSSTEEPMKLNRSPVPWVIDKL